MESNTKTTEYTHLLPEETASTTEQPGSCWEQTESCCSHALSIVGSMIDWLCCADRP